MEESPRGAAGIALNRDWHGRAGEAMIRSFCAGLSASMQMKRVWAKAGVRYFSTILESFLSLSLVGLYNRLAETELSASGSLPESRSKL